MVARGRILFLGTSVFTADGHQDGDKVQHATYIGIAPKDAHRAMLMPYVKEYTSTHLLTGIANGERLTLSKQVACCVQY
jgi:hypothetical protein